MNDISLTSDWNPIGSEETPFTGELNGNYYKINNLNINKKYADGNDWGLFRYISGSNIHHIEISGNVRGYGWVGLLAAQANSSNTITGVTTNGTVYGESNNNWGAGGIIGYSKQTTFQKCHFSGTISR